MVLTRQRELHLVGPDCRLQVVERTLSTQPQTWLAARPSEDVKSRCARISQSVMEMNVSPSLPFHTHHSLLIP